VKSRRLEDRIRELCARVVAAKSFDELNLILPELRSAIHQAIQRVRLRAAAILAKPDNLPVERRKNP
jgi:hypothetical protein